MALILSFLPLIGNYIAALFIKITMNVGENQIIGKLTILPRYHITENASNLGNIIINMTAKIGMRGTMSTIAAVDNHLHVEVGMRVSTRTATIFDGHPRTETGITAGIKTFASLPHASLTSVVVMTVMHITK